MPKKKEGVVVCAETRADAYAEFRAVPRADHLQNPVQAFVQIVMQKRWLKRQNEAAVLHFVSNWFDFGSTRYKIALMQKDLQNIVQMSVQKHGAERRWKPVQVIVQMLVQIIVQKNGTDAEIRGVDGLHGTGDREEQAVARNYGAEIYAEPGAVIRAEGVAERRAEIYAEVRAARRAESAVQEVRKLRAVCYVVSRGGESQNS